MSVLGILDAMRTRGERTFNDKPGKYPGSVFRVWACLENHCGRWRFWTLTAEKIAAEINLSLRTVKAAILILERDGIISRRMTKRRGTLFFMKRSYGEGKAGSFAAPGADEAQPPDEPQDDEPDVPVTAEAGEVVVQSEGVATRVVVQNLHHKGPSCGAIPAPPYPTSKNPPVAYANAREGKTLTDPRVPGPPGTAWNGREWRPVQQPERGTSAAAIAGFEAWATRTAKLAPLPSAPSTSPESPRKPAPSFNAILPIRTRCVA